MSGSTSTQTRVDPSVDFANRELVHAALVNRESGDFDDDETSTGEAGAIDVADLPWIIGCERCRSTVERLCRRSGFEPRTRHITDNPGAIQALESNSLGVALLPQSARRTTAVGGIEAISIAEVGTRRISALVPTELETTREITDLLDALRTLNDDARAQPA